MDEAGKPIDISCCRRTLCSVLTAAPNPHFVNNGNATSGSSYQACYQPSCSCRRSNGPQPKGIGFLNAMGEQMRAYEAAEAKKKAEQEAAARAKAEREGIAYVSRWRGKQQESLLAQEKEKQRKVIEAKQRAQQVKSKREQFAGTIVRTKAKIIEEKEVAPGWRYKLRGQPAWTARCGSDTQRQPDQVLSMDGVPGPTFDELMDWRPNIQVPWSRCSVTAIRIKR